MNKLDFLRRLDKELSMLDREERREILAFYEERFYNGTIYENKTEEEVIAELERPEVIARNVLAEYGVSPTYVKKKEERYSNISTTKAILLIAFDVLIASSVIPALFGAAIAIIGSSFSWFTTLGIIIGEHTTVDEFTFAFVTAAFFLLFLFGLVVLEAALWVTRTIIKWHLNVFKAKNRDKYIKKLSRFSVDSWFKKHRRARSLKNLLLVGSLITIVYTGYWIFNHYDWVKAEYGAGEMITETVTEDFTTEIANNEEWIIETDLENIKVNVVLVSGDDLTITHTYLEEDNYEYDFNFETNTISISNDTEPTVNFFWNPRDLFTLFSGETGVRIEIPSELHIDEFDLVTSNSSVTINNVDSDTLNINTSNGAIVLNNSNVANDADLVTSNSKIDVSNVVVGSDMYLRSTNGKIYVDDVMSTTSGALTVFTSNSSVYVTNVNFADYNISSTNGSLNVTDVNTENKDGNTITLDTSNSKIVLRDVYVDDIDAETSNGDITFMNEDTTYHPSSLELQTSSYQDVDTNVTE